VHKPLGFYALSLFEIREESLLTQQCIKTCITEKKDKFQTPWRTRVLELPNFL